MNEYKGQMWKPCRKMGDYLWFYTDKSYIIQLVFFKESRFKNFIKSNGN